MKKQVCLFFMLGALALTGCGGNGGNGGGGTSQGGGGEQVIDLGVKDIHTELQNQYLNDEWTTNTKYIEKVNAEDNQQHPDLGGPTAIKLEFDEVYDAETYYVEIADNANFTNSKIVETNTKSYDFYNGKLGQEYYYRAYDFRDELDLGQVKKFTVTDQTPRNLNVDGVMNFRDIGGWSTSLVPGAKIRQGLYYRCAQFNSITAAGKATLKELGISVDIDMRDRPPAESPATSDEWPVAIVDAHIASGTESTRFSGFADTYKTIFDQIAKVATPASASNPKSGPIGLHCSYGADRTGIASFFLLAVLGASEEECGRDYSWTRFAGQRAVKHDVEYDGWVSATKEYEVDAKYNTDAYKDQKFAEQMKKHLLSKGIAEDTIETIREIFIPGYVKQSAAA